MGKSTALQLLAEQGIATVDTDAIARQVVEPGEPALAEVVARFGQDVLTSEGRLNRGELARRVFSDPAERRALEGIMHPRIRERWLAQADAWRRQGRPTGVVVIPLLFETNAAGAFDAVLCVACLPKTQAERLKTRGWTEQQIEERIQAQWPTEKKMALAQFVIWTEGSVHAHAEQLRRVLASLS